MKKILMLSLVVLFFALTPHALVHAQQGFTALAPIPGLTDQTTTSVVDAATLANFFNNLYKYLIGLAAVLAVIEIIWGGIEISTKDSVSKKTDGKARIYQAILGLILVLSPVIVFTIINPSILNLSLNLPELKTTTTASVSNNFGTGDAPTAKAADCSVALGGGTVGCPTQAAAQAFAASCSNGQGSVFSTNDPKLPYSAGCNSLQPFQGHRDYSNVADIPKGYWCFKVKVIANATVSYTYACQVDKNSCSSLALNNPVAGQIVGSGGCDPY
ncbi:MAG: hypothetical protein WC217_01435 [Candidatus Paceibacterota bacterium]|jgi:hypothetical protein